MPKLLRRRGAVAVLSLAVLGGAATAASAAAAATCYPRDALLALLAERYGEQPVGAGVAQGHLVELLARPDGASWTIVVLRPGPDGSGGLACPLAAGEGWTNLAAPPAGPEASS